MKQDNSITVKPWVRKYANVEDATTGDSFEVFVFRKTLGRKGKLRIERDKAREHRLVMAALAKKNAVLPFEDSEAIKLIALTHSGGHNSWSPSRAATTFRLSANPSRHGSHPKFGTCRR